jgi:predicted SnoaL-like aldol condensation-catalyzing enzyme
MLNSKYEFRIRTNAEYVQMSTGGIHMSQKEKAVSFLKMASGGDVRAAYERFIAPEFIHHNQYFKGDRESLMIAMEEASQKSPNKSIDVKHVYEAGDTVITHSHVTRQDPTEPGIAVIHIFRFKNGRIVELWDLGQPMINESPNENGVF